MRAPAQRAPCAGQRSAQRLTAHSPPHGREGEVIGESERCEPVSEMRHMAHVNEHRDERGETTTRESVRAPDASELLQV